MCLANDRLIYTSQHLWLGQDPVRQSQEPDMPNPVTAFISVASFRFSLLASGI